MTRGQVTGGWAWRHHRKWLRELVEPARADKARAYGRPVGDPCRAM